VKKIYFKLFAEHIEFDTNEQKKEIEKLKEYTFYSKCFVLEELFSSLIRIKGDWLTHEIHEDKNNIYASITLLYPFTNGERVKNIPTEVFEVVEDFINQKKSITSLEESNENDEEEVEGFLIKIEDHCQIEELDILLELKKHSLEYEIITSTVKRTETGAGDLLSEVILFVQNTVVSGIAWDIIKSGLIMMSPFSKVSKSIDERKVENVNYNRLRKDIALRISIDSKALILIDMYKENDNILLRFKGNDSVITVLCDKNYIIQELNVEESVLNK